MPGVDPNALAQTLGRVTQSASSDSADTAQRERTPHPDAVSLLLFRAGSQRRKAVPLSLVTRIEDIDCRRIEVADGQHLLQYRDQLIPLLGIDMQSGPKKEGAQPILVFSSRGRTMDMPLSVASRPKLLTSAACCLLHLRTGPTGPLGRQRNRLAPFC